MLAIDLLCYLGYRIRFYYRYLWCIQLHIEYSSSFFLQQEEASLSSVPCDPLIHLCRLASLTRM